MVAEFSKYEGTEGALRSKNKECDKSGTEIIKLAGVYRKSIPFSLELIRLAGMLLVLVQVFVFLLRVIPHLPSF